jgi:hypothetical protein
MIGRSSFLTLLAMAILSGAPGLAAQAPGDAHHPRAEWRHEIHRWAGHGERLERRGFRCRHHTVRLERRDLHRFRRWEQKRHLARRPWHRRWDRIV